jgi:hypothetical protein
VASERKGSSHVGAEAVLPFADCLKCLFENYIAHEDDRALLKRWLDRDRKGTVWSAIRARAEQHEGPIGVDAPIYFIIFILEMKKAAEQESKANADIAVMAAKIKKLKTEFTSKIGRDAKRVPFEKRAEFLKRAGKRLEGYPSAVISPPRVRSDKKGSRARTYFIREVSGYVHDVTGRWLDEQVGVITEIAFNTSEIISGDTVRKARSK